VKIACILNSLVVLLAGDSTKLRAQNAKKNNFNQIIERPSRQCNKLQEYNLSLAKETGISNSKVVSLKDQKALKTKYI
jgi:hypothetical protein